jgi:poly(A) polymerase
MNQPPTIDSEAGALRVGAVDVVRRLQAAGFAAFWAGGCVRDAVLGVTPKDYDVATSARPENIEALFPQTVGVGRQFGVLVAEHSGHWYQIATFRSDLAYVDGRRPVAVQFSDARTDASRRDFTINGLFYDPIADQLWDWVGGREDLAARVIRTIGDPGARFQEDHLRLLRAVRFAVQLDFGIESATLAAIRAHASLIGTVSAERVREELLKLFRGARAAVALDYLNETGLLEQVLPEIAATQTVEQSPDYHPEGTVYQHIRKMLGLLPETSDPLLSWAVLLHDVGKGKTAIRDGKRIHFYGHEKVGAEMAETILQRLKFPRRDIEIVTEAVRDHMRYKDVPQMRAATRRQLLLRPNGPLQLELHRLDCLGSHGQLKTYDLLKAELEVLAAKPALTPPLLRGDDLIALGLRPGPKVGALLAAVRERQLQEELSTPEEARAWVRGQLQRERTSEGTGEMN